MSMTSTSEVAQNISFFMMPFNVKLVVVKIFGASSLESLPRDSQCQRL